MRPVPRAAVWLFAAVLALVCGACRSRDHEPLLVAATPWVGNTPLMAARERKLFGDTEVRIVELSTDFDAWRAIREGRADVATGTLFDVLRFVDHGADLRIVMVTDFSNGADGIVAREGITRIQDLAGRTVAVEKSTFTHFILLRALERAGMREDEVALANLASDEALAALDEGRVDAAALWEPLLTHAKKPGRRLLFTSAEIPGEILDVLAVRTDVLRDRPGAVRDLLRGFDRGVAAFAADPPGATETIARLMNLDAEDAAAVLPRVELVGFTKNATLFDRSRKENLWHAYGLAERFMQNHAMLRHAPRPADDLIDGGPLADAVAARP